MVAQHVDYSIIFKEMKESGSLGKCEGVPYNNVIKQGACCFLWRKRKVKMFKYYLKIIREMKKKRKELTIDFQGGSGKYGGLWWVAMAGLVLLISFCFSWND